MSIEPLASGRGGDSTARIALALLRGLARHAWTQGRRRLDLAVERRRMRRVRRNPTALVAALQSATGVLIVCQGNIIRSAFAARLLAQAIGDRAPVSICSGGLDATPGSPPHPAAAAAAVRVGLDLSPHASAAVAPPSVARADVIFVMEIPQLVDMRMRFPHARARTYLLTCLAPGASLEIRDPVGRDHAAFQACFDHISQAVRPIVRILSGPGRPQ